MVDAGKARLSGASRRRLVGAQDSIEAARRAAEDTRMKQLIQEQFSTFFITQETSMPPAVAGEEDAIPGGNESRAGDRDRNVPDEYYLAACYGAFIAGSANEMRKLLAAASVTDGITPAFRQRLEDIVHIVEVIDDGHRFRMAYLRKHRDTQMHHGDTFALDVHRERRKNHRPSALRRRLPARNDRDRDGGGGSRKISKTTRPAREAVAQRATFPKHATKDSDKGKANVELPTVDTAE
eukprot:jgi/Tetstr1/459149/TSEL_004596.t1